MDKYLEALQIDKDVVQTYYLRDIETKSEQQKFLERILKESTGVKSVRVYRLYYASQGNIHELSRFSAP